MSHSPSPSSPSPGLPPHSSSLQLKPHALTLTIATLLASHGYRKGSLSLSGGVGAGVVGYLHLANDNPVFGVGLLSFYAISTIATKYKAGMKARLEEGHVKGQEAGGRTVWQVLSNSTPSLISSILYRFLYTSERYPPLINYLHRVAPGLGVGGAGEGFSRGLVMAGLGHLACCFGDTLSSELGILSPTPPLLLTTLHPCPPGTNGAISPLGTIVAFIAGAGMGGLFWAFEKGRGEGVLRVGSAVVGGGGGRGFGWWVWVGGLAGLGGSLLDSLLGATIQQTLQNTSTNKILTHSPNRSIKSSKTSATSTSTSSTATKAEPANEAAKVRKVNGWDILSNNQVNFVSSGVVAVVMGWMGWRGII